MLLYVTEASRAANLVAQPTLNVMGNSRLGGRFTFPDVFGTFRVELCSVLVPGFIILFGFCPGQNTWPVVTLSQLRHRGQVFTMDGSFMGWGLWSRANSLLVSLLYLCTTLKQWQILRMVFKLN